MKRAGLYRHLMYCKCEQDQREVRYPEIIIETIKVIFKAGSHNDVKTSVAYVHHFMNTVLT